MQKLVETFLFTQPDWVPAQAIAARFCLDERSLRASGKQPGLLSKVAVFSDKGFKHLRFATASECRHRLKREIISRVRRLKWLKEGERNVLASAEPYSIEKHTNQELLPGMKL
jgi:hypothetical protein